MEREATVLNREGLSKKVNLNLNEGLKKIKEQTIQESRRELSRKSSFKCKALRWAHTWHGVETIKRLSE